MSQQKDNLNKGNLIFYYEYSHFKYFQDPEQTYFQLFFYMPRNILKFLPVDTNYFAKFSVDVRFTDLQDSSKIITKNWTSALDNQIAAKDTAADFPLLFESNFAIKPSKYQLAIRITDVNDSNRWGYQQTMLEIPGYKSNDLQISDIQFATQISKSENPDELFYKNGFVIVPNPSKIFGTNLPRLFLYAEIYNLKHPAKEGYTAEFIIADEQENVIKEMPVKNFKKAGETAVLMHSFNIISLSSGRYFLYVRIKDQANQAVAQSKKMFIVYHEGESLSEITDFDSFFKDLDLVSSELAENVVYYLLSDKERKTLKMLDLEGKKKFFDRFWKERDPSPGTKTNENLIENYKRYSEANQRFTTPNRQGWKTDMGRVYIIYGAPAQIEKHDFEQKILPYQRWYYYQLKDQPSQTEFIFADKDGSGIYQLIHSNAKGELSNRNWEKDIQSFSIDK
jgi:GWxTD domain-containing protein